MFQHREPTRSAAPSSKPCDAPCEGVGWPLVRSLLASLAEDNFLWLVLGYATVVPSASVIWRDPQGTIVGGDTLYVFYHALLVGAAWVTPGGVEAMMGV